MRFLTVIFFCVLCSAAFAQNYCNTNRYDTLDIFQNVQLKTDTLVYGYNYDWNGVLDTLGLFVFYPSPAADTATKRPMILMFHGGGFTTGSAKSMKSQAQYFARKGYVAVTVDYRIGLNKDCISGNLTQHYATYRASQDAHAAGRYMIAHAAQYKIDTAAVFLYGRSAGAIMSLVLQYASDENASRLFPLEVPASLGGLHNATNNYTNHLSIKGICAVSGGLTDTSVITAANLVPTQMFHGTADATVPYNIGYSNSCNQFPKVYGSFSIKTRIKNLGGVYDFYYQTGGGHGEIYETVDTFFYHHVSQFFKRIFCDKNRQATYDYITQVEDVNLNCSGANGGTVSANSQGFCTSGAAILNSGGYSTGWGSSYQWQFSTDSINWNNYAGAINPAIFAADSINTTNWYRLKTGCSYTNSEAYSNIVKAAIFPKPIVSANAGMIACAGGTTTVSVTASGGTAPYSGEGNFEITAGTYNYTVTDANGCSASTEIVVTEPQALSAHANAGIINCAGAATTVAVSESGGTAPYSGEGNFEVTAGTYNYTVTDANGCTASSEITVTEPQVLAAHANAGIISCADGTTTVLVTASGGTAPYSGEGNFEITAGTYNYTVTDANGCSGSTEIVVTEPQALSAHANAGIINCAGGTITVVVTASGGTAPYSGEGNFEITAGTYNYIVTDTNGCSASTEITVIQPQALLAHANANAILCTAGTTTVSVTASGGTAPYSGEGNFEVTAGTYNYTVTDANGCSASSEITVTEPQALTANANAGTINCAGGTTTVSVSSSGGTAPYSGEGNFEVTAGTYNYTITDANGCSASTGIVVTEPQALTAHANANAISCTGGTTTVSVTASGGTAPYSGEGNFTVSSGAYRYPVTDANGCRDTASITLATENIHSPGKPGKITGNASNLCGGGQFNYSVQPVANASFYSWELPAEFLVTQNNNSIVVNIPSSFITSGEIKVTAGNGCGNSKSRVLKIFAVAGNVSNKINGPAAVVAYQNNVSYNVNAFTGYTYNWTVPAGATIVSGQGTKKIFVNFGAAGGNITVTLSNACGSKKGVLATTVSSSLAARKQNDESINQNIIIQPNPVTDKAIIQFNALRESEYSILIKDMSGKVCLQKKGDSVQGNNIIQFNTSALSNGNYMVTLACDDKIYHLKMVKAR